MTHDDSVQIAATSPARGRGRPQAATRGSVGRQSIPDVVFAAGRAKRGIGIATEAKFSCLQSLENSQNGERISIFRGPIPQAGGTPHTNHGGRGARSAAAHDPGALDPARASTRVVGELDRDS